MYIEPNGVANKKSICIILRTNKTTNSKGSLAFLWYFNGAHWIFFLRRNVTTWSFSKAHKVCVGVYKMSHLFSINVFPFMYHRFSFDIQFYWRRSLKRALILKLTIILISLLLLFDILLVLVVTLYGNLILFCFCTKIRW